MSLPSVFPASYGVILLEVLVICLHCTITGFAIGGLRKQFFNEKFMQKNFPTLKGAKGGFPDMGQGRISDKLSDDEWFRFNNAQRAHYNYVEGLPAIVCSLLVSGISYPRFSFVLGVVYIVGRALYISGYLTKGPAGRTPGVYILDLALFLLIGAACFSSVELAGGMAGLAKFAQSFVQ